MEKIVNVLVNHPCKGLPKIAFHSGGLNHSWELKPREIPNVPGLNQLDEKSRNKKMIKENLMNSDENSNSDFMPKKNNNKIEPGQIINMFKHIESKRTLQEQSFINKSNISNPPLSVSELQQPQL